MSTQPEVWRVSTPEGTFEIDLETLKQWIREDSVQPTDKVSKGNLNWIDAGRVPQLKAAFSGELTSVIESNSITTVSAPPSTTTCLNHPEANPDYVCRMCGAVFCKTCPKFVRDRVPLCPLCGDLCRKYQDVTEKIARLKLQKSGFGAGDFVRAIRYPMQHKTALFGGALVYGVLLLAGARGGLLARTLMFACISHVITHVAWGRLNRSFMPDFSAYSTWDDCVVPAMLGSGVMIVSWGPVIALALALMFGVVSGGGVEAPSLRSGNQVAESQIAREAEKFKTEANDPDPLITQLFPYLGTKTTVGTLLVLFILWGVFYHPMALTVAGYTQSFRAVINPLVGLDTIRRMRTIYFKAFGMVIVIQVISFVLGVIIYAITLPLALPDMGNLFGNFIDATFTFYLNLVIACILGLSLFKCADRLDIQVD